MAADKTLPECETLSDAIASYNDAIRKEFDLLLELAAMQQKYLGKVFYMFDADDAKVVRCLGQTLQKFRSELKVP